MFLVICPNRWSLVGKVPPGHKKIDWPQEDTMAKKKDKKKDKKKKDCKKKSCKAKDVKKGKKKDKKKKNKKKK